MYASISTFLKTKVAALIENSVGPTTMTLITSGFDYLYMGLILMTIIVSLTTPVDRGAIYFKFLMIMFGLLLMTTMLGILYYLCS